MVASSVGALRLRVSLGQRPSPWVPRGVRSRNLPYRNLCRGDPALRTDRRQRGCDGERVAVLRTSYQRHAILRHRQGQRVSLFSCNAKMHTSLQYIINVCQYLLSVTRLTCIQSSGGCWSFKEGKLMFGLHHISCQFIYM